MLLVADWVYNETNITKTQNSKIPLVDGHHIRKYITWLQPSTNQTTDCPICAKLCTNRRKILLHAITVESQTFEFREFKMADDVFAPKRNGRRREQNLLL